jgi:hypothetical protein
MDCGCGREQLSYVLRIPCLAIELRSSGNYLSCAIGRIVAEILELLRDQISDGRRGVHIDALVDFDASV